MRSPLAVLNIYRAHPLFTPLLIALAAVMVVVKFLQVMRMWLPIEDVMTLWLVFWMIQGFLLGVLAKRQLTSPMARILPGYRSAHVGTFVALFGGVAGSTALWMLCLPEITPRTNELLPLVALCNLTYLITVLVAYVSVRWIVMTSYIVLLVIVTHVLDVLQWVADTPHAFLGLSVIILVMTFALFFRMAFLREGMWEFPHLLSWPLYRSSGGEGKCSARDYRPSAIPPFASLKGTWQKAQHWEHPESEHLWGMTGLLLVGAGVFEMCVLAQGASEAFYAKPFSNFVVFVLTPVFITQCFNYRIMAFGQSALLWPIRREDLIKQWGFRVAGYLVSAWVLTAILFAVIPGMLLDLPFILMPRFWAYLALTGLFAYLVLAWLALLAAMTESRRVIVHMVILCLLTQAEFMVMPYTTIDLLLMNGVLVVLGNVLLTRAAYRKWLEVEF